MDVKYHVISTLVENKPGVLQKVAGLFTRRDFNIDSITVGESEVNGLARMVITVKADEKILEQVTKQLNKLVDVVKIKDISKNAVKRELCLIKVNIPNEKSRAEIMQYANISILFFSLYLFKSFRYCFIFLSSLNMYSLFNPCTIT